MSSSSRDSAKQEPVVELSVAQAFDEAMAFPVARCNQALMAPGDLEGRATDEARFGRVTIDQNGLTPGMQLNAFEPVRQTLSAWRQAREAFDRTLAPFSKELNALRETEAQKQSLIEQREEEVVSREQQAGSYTRLVEARNRLGRAEERFRVKYDENNQRVANTLGANWLYFIGIGCIGIAEWLINYDTFMSFLQVPAIAAGATLVLGALLAFAAHAHGTLMKQWSHRFGAHRDPRERFSSWRLLGLATFGLLVVLAAAGGSRYAAAMRVLAETPHFNILGADAVVQRDPLRDVLLSLLANVAAWAVGVFLAYNAHDPDPDYMEAQIELTRARRLNQRVRAPVERDIEFIRARFNKQIKERESRTQSQFQAVEHQRSLQQQVDAREEAIIGQLSEVARQNAEVYRAVLVRLAAQERLPLSFIAADEQNIMQPEAYLRMPLRVAPSTVARWA